MGIQLRASPRRELCSSVVVPSGSTVFKAGAAYLRNVSTCPASLPAIISHTILTGAYPPSLMDVVLFLLLSKVKYIPNSLSFFFEDNPLCVNSKRNILPDWFLCKKLPNSKVSEAEKGPLGHLS